MGIKIGSEKYDKTIRLSTRLKLVDRKYFFTILRFLTYGICGVFGEICLYSFVRIFSKLFPLRYLFGFKWRIDDALNLNAIWNVPWYTFFGQCSLWMFFMYGTATFLIVEPFYIRMFHIKWYLRGIVYSLSILIFELISGILLYQITKYRIWTYEDSLNIFHFTSLYTIPLWFCSGLLAESVFREFIGENVKKRVLLRQTQIESSKSLNT